MISTAVNPQNTTGDFPSKKTSKNHPLFDYNVIDNEEVLPHDEKNDSHDQPAEIKLIARNSANAQAPKKLLFLSEIKLDDDLQPRIKINPSTVSDYARAMRQGDEFPPIEVYLVDGDYLLIDGYHRFHAAKKEKWTKISCNVHTGTKREAILHSAGMNATHGDRRTRQDMHYSVERVLKDSICQAWSDRAIATTCHVSHTFVAKIRKNLTGNVASENDKKERAYTSKHGTSATMETSKIGKKQDTTVPVRLIKTTNEVHDVTEVPTIDKPDILSSDSREQISNKFVRMCLDADQRAVLDQIITQGEAVTHLEALEVVIDWARTQLEG